MTTPANELNVAIVNRDQRIWEGKANSVSSENSAGRFDILPQHANFITLIRNKPITIRETTGKSQTMTYKTAVLSIKEDRLMIYTDI
jgi:F0F1-type ATP synthase epsilon subunit